MFKKNIEYVDFNGTERSEDFYFHMSLPELARLEAKLNGVTLEDHVKKLAADIDVNNMMAFVEDIILSSYGVKSADGKSFLKSPELRKEFEYSQAYAELFEEFMTNPESAKKFAEGVGTTSKKTRNE